MKRYPSQRGLVAHREDPLLLGPDPGAVGPAVAGRAAVEEALPLGRRRLGQLRQVVLHVQQAAVVVHVPYLSNHATTTVRTT